MPNGPESPTSSPLSLYNVSMRHNTPFRFLLPLLFCFSLVAQGTASIQFTQTFTSATTGSAVNNGPTISGGPQGSVAFRLVYYIEPGTGTVSALSVELDGAATSGGSYSALTPAVGGGSGSGSTLNPVTTFPRGQNVLCCDYWPFLKIKVNTLTVATGTPILLVKVLGYAGTSAAADQGGGGGGSGITALTQDVLASGSGSVAATVVGIDTVPLCSGFAPTNGQFLKYSTALSPNPCYTAAVPAGGGTIATTTNALVGDGAGNAIAASGTATNCLQVNGGNTSCSGGGGGGGGTGLTVYSGLAGVSLTNATIYFPVGGGSLANATEASVQTFQGSAGTVSGFGVSLSTSLGGTNSVVLTWRKNAAGQSVTCTITAPALTCSDTTHSFTFAASDTLDIQAVLTGTIAATPIWVMTAGVSSGSSTAGSFVLVEQHTASSSAALNFTTCISSTYDTYNLQLVGMLPTTTGSSFVLQAHAGGSYDTGANYNWLRLAYVAASAGSAGNPTDTSILLIVREDTSGAYAGQGNFTLYNPNPGTIFPTIFGQSSSSDQANANTLSGQQIIGTYIQTTAMDGFRITAPGDTIASGTARCYGLAK